MAVARFGIRWSASGYPRDRPEFDLHPEALRPGLSVSDLDAPNMIG
jgi:hypothetical protein